MKSFPISEKSSWTMVLNISSVPISKVSPHGQCKNKDYCFFVFHFTTVFSSSFTSIFSIVCLVFFQCALIHFPFSLFLYFLLSLLLLLILHFWDTGFFFHLFPECNLFSILFSPFVFIFKFLIKGGLWDPQMFVGAYLILLIVLCFVFIFFKTLWRV